MKPAIKKVQPVKVVAPFINEQSESITPLDILVMKRKFLIYISLKELSDK